MFASIKPDCSVCRMPDEAAPQTSQCSFYTGGGVKFEVALMKEIRHRAILYYSQLISTENEDADLP